MVWQTKCILFYSEKYANREYSVGISGEDIASVGIGKGIYQGDLSFSFLFVTALCRFPFQQGQQSIIITNVINNNDNIMVGFNCTQRFKSFI